MFEILASQFETRRHAWGFVGVLAFFLTLPLLLSVFGKPTRDDVFASIPGGSGPIPYIKQEIYDEKADIDILFLGTSLLWVGIDSQYMKQEVSKKIGKEARVLTIGTNWRGEDLNYVFLRDLLQRRRVRMLVVSMPHRTQVMDEPHSQAYHWWVYGDHHETLLGLPFRYQFQLYADAVLGAPRHLLSLARPNYLEDPGGYKETFGAYKVQSGYAREKFVPIEPLPPKLATKDLVYSRERPGFFRFTGQALNPFQEHFLKKFGKLVTDHGVKLAVVHMPLASEMHSTVVEERQDWSEFFGFHVPLVGIPMEILFKKMHENQVYLYYYDEHLNKNGNEYFTRAIAPTLLEIYEKERPL